MSLHHLDWQPITYFISYLHILTTLFYPYCLHALCTTARHIPAPWHLYSFLQFAWFFHHLDSGGSFLQFFRSLHKYHLCPWPLSLQFLPSTTTSNPFSVQFTRYLSSANISQALRCSGQISKQRFLLSWALHSNRKWQAISIDTLIIRWVKVK